MSGSAAGSGVRISATADPPADWDGFMAGADGATFFHASVWHLAASRWLDGAEPVWITARKGDRLVGGLPVLALRRGPLRLLCSSHDGTGGGPAVAPDLSAEEATATAKALLDELAGSFCGPLSSVRICSGSGGQPELGGLLGAGWRGWKVPVAVIPLDGGLERVDADILKMNRRNERNRSLRRGCTVDASSDPADLDAFWPIYLEATRRWGTAPVPRGMVSELLERGGGDVFLTCVRREGGMLGAHLNFHFGDRVTAWLGATARNSKDVFPSTMVVWGDLQEACARGAAVLDLGGSGGLKGVENFKRLLGAGVEERSCWSRTGLLYGAAEAGRRLIRGGKR